MTEDAYLAVRIAGETIALPAHAVGQVIQPGQIMPVPRSGAEIVGIASLRSQIYTLVDPAVIVGAGAVDIARARHAVTLSGDRHNRALVVERVIGIVHASEPVARPQATLPASWRPCALGTVETPAGRVLVVDPNALTGGKAEPHFAEQATQSPENRLVPEQEATR